MVRNFNTSNVTVQHAFLEMDFNPILKFQYIKCDGSAGYNEDAYKVILEFQYIKCDGSAQEALNTRAAV